MEWMLATIWVGFSTAFLHVFSGPDHLAAVSPLSIQRQKQSWKTGLVWGGGHATGVYLLGSILLLLRETLPVETISSYSERLVGMVLIAMGAWGIQKSFRSRIHSHAHTHDGTTHVHIHAHVHPHGEHNTTFHSHSHASWWIGVIHGLAGGSHVLGVLPTLVMPSRAAAAAYLISFSIGTMAAMSIFSGGIGWASTRLTHHRIPLHSLLMGSGVVCVGLGFYWLWS